MTAELRARGRGEGNVVERLREALRACDALLEAVAQADGYIGAGSLMEAAWDATKAALDNRPPPAGGHEGTNAR
jgi:hypothetical protein